MTAISHTSNLHLLKRLLKSFCIAVMLFCAHTGKAQSDPQLTQYWAVPTYYNPAATGDTDFVRIRGGARLQWLGIENAPKSFLATADMPLKIGKQRIGLGVDFTQESLGLFSNMLANVQASYKKNMLKGQLSIGVQLGYYNSSFKGSDVYIPDDDDYHQSTDQSIPNTDISGSTIDFSAGLNYTHKYFSVGISGLHLLQPTVKMQVEGSESTESQQYETELTRALYFIGSGNIPIKNSLFVLQPSLLLRTSFSDFSAEISARTVYNNFLSFGVGYRLNDAVSVMIGAEFKNFFLGYAYDYPLSAIAKGSSGSHEIIAGYQLKLDFSEKNKNKHRSIRIM